VHPDASVDHESLTAHCRRLIAGYKCPRTTSFVGALPLSAAGKVLKATLRERYADLHSADKGTEG
jgi:Acyl-CoA synthetases (AMP-forming)/AMP-acid ligases II